ncbi:RNA polymerase sigma factor [Kribbella shirazensis]|uniref:RNA polymerase sigma-70 factor (ECF subfamily) n=1 Tax=Kribbella shirazensis TaxID=1105143 RepID=A0A7X6A534_9ACTN|nr:RNA polymerase sigma factor [Kribbella shirazensis]NIK60874.1 RNA polymerase sigma-70 factor (ECF subfamily) [Kribbella shirazensis]
MEREPNVGERAETGMQPAVPTVPVAGSEPPADADVIRGATREEFALLFDRHAMTIHRYVARRLSTADADDLLSQTFLIAYERRDRYVGPADGALPWLYGIATNLIHRRRRSEVRQYRAYARSEPAGRYYGDPLAGEVASRVDAEAAQRALTRALAGLREQERDVLLLYAWEDLGYAEIAAALDIPVGTVRSRLHRARKSVRAALGPSFEDPS